MLSNLTCPKCGIHLSHFEPYCCNDACSWIPSITEQMVMNNIIGKRKNNMRPDRPDNEKHNEPRDKKIFKPWFKYCPKCGGKFVEMDNGQWKCDKCGQSAFRAHNRYYSKFSMWRREIYQGYHHGD